MIALKAVNFKFLITFLVFKIIDYLPSTWIVQLNKIWKNIIYPMKTFYIQIYF